MQRVADLTEGILGKHRFFCLQRLSNTVHVFCLHPELVLGSLLEPGHLVALALHDARHPLPVVTTLLALLHYVTCTPGKIGRMQYCF